MRPAILLATATILSILLGDTTISISDLIAGALTTSEQVILSELRIPRTIACITIGAALATCGVLLQAFFRNPLACPSIIGVSTLSAAGGLSLFFILGGLTSFYFTVGSTLGALIAAILLSFAAGYLANASLILYGLAINFIGSASILIVQYLSDPSELARISLWMLGSLSIIGVERPIISLLVSAPLIAIAWYLGKQLDVLSCGDDFAKSRGVSIFRLSTAIFCITAVLITIVINLCGPIGFVGLVSPHLARQISGATHRDTIPCAAAIGATYLLIADIITRVLPTPGELPLGIITAISGGMIFLVIVFKRA